MSRRKSATPKEQMLSKVDAALAYLGKDPEYARLNPIALELGAEVLRQRDEIRLLLAARNMNGPMTVDEALRELGNNVYKRYLACEDGFATPSSLLLAVANAIKDVEADAAKRLRGKR